MELGVWSLISVERGFAITPAVGNAVLMRGVPKLHHR